jgi:hypothetical protein
MSWPGEMYLDELCLAVTASLRPLGMCLDDGLFGNNRARRASFSVITDQTDPLLAFPLDNLVVRSVPLDCLEEYTACLIKLPI